MKRKEDFIGCIRIVILFAAVIAAVAYIDYRYHESKQDLIKNERP